MNTRPALDRESFEKPLANAFAVQNSQLNRQSLSAVIEVQSLIQSGQLDLDGTAHLIADCARNVADATGICIGLLKGNQLVFRAGSGSGAVYVGQQVMASLTVSADSNTSGEILRVENADADTRIDAAICRQFGAKALLILPIYQDRTVAGVLEILFSEPHAFEDRELRTYRLMARLVGDVMSHAAQVETAKNLTVELPPNLLAARPVASQSETALKHAVPIAVQNETNEIHQASKPSIEGTRKVPVRGHVTTLGTLIIEQAKRVFQTPGRWGTALAGAALVIACWIAFSTRHVASPLQSSTKPGSVGVEQQPVLPTKTVQSEAVAKPRTAPLRRQRTRMENADVEYIGDDVIVRHFTPRPAPNRVLVGSNDVHHIGDDVTVRYFTSKPSLVQAKQPVVR
jgi:putative methionine-R-sulfoxide reductase with GAF domain